VKAGLWEVSTLDQWLASPGQGHVNL
jgi:hypothetical protein